MLNERILALPIPTLSFSALFIVFPLLLLVSILFLVSRGWRRNYHRLPPSPPALPIVGHLYLMGPLIHQSLQNLSHRYGPFFSMRLGSDPFFFDRYLGSVPCIVVSSPDIAREFLKVNEAFFLARKKLTAVKHLMNESSYAFSSDGPYWKFVNKLIVTHFLNPRALNKKFLTIRNENMQAFLNILTNNSLQGVKTNLSDELTKFSSSIICYMMLGVRLHDAKGQANYEACRGLAREVSETFGLFNVSDFIWVCKGLDLQGIKKKILDVKGRYEMFIDNIITEREEFRREKKQSRDHDLNKEAAVSVRSFLDVFLDLMEDESTSTLSEVKMTKDDFKAVVLDFLTAATDTSSVSIEWVLAELIKNPSLLKKAQEEIDRVVGKDRLVQEADLRNLPYITAIIKETYRLHPPIPLLIRRSTHDCKISRYDIPRNTILFVNVWATGRDPKCWENPLEFRPERFFQVGEKNENSLGLSELRGQNFKLMPFGTGKRSCPGVNLASLVVPTVVSVLIQCFDWKLSNLAKGEVKNDDDSVIDMSEKPGLTAPRASDLICVPELRIDPSMFDASSSQQGY